MVWDCEPPVPKVIEVADSPFDLDQTDPFTVALTDAADEPCPPEE